MTEAGSLAVLILVSGFCWSALLALTLRGRGIVAFYSPVLLVPLFSVASATVWLGQALFDQSSTADWSWWLRMILRDLSVVICMDLAFSQFVAPLHPLLIRKDPDAPTDGVETAPTDDLPPRDLPVADGAEPTEEMLCIGPERFNAADIIAIRAEDHYLRVATTNGRAMLRGRLSDATAQIDIRRGMQVNRSAWVAFEAIEEVAEDGRGMVTIRLTDSTTERVAQSRRIAFRAAMALRNRS